MDGGPDDLLEEPLFLNGAFVRRWDDLAELPRADAVAPLRRRPGRGWLRITRAVPAPRLPRTLRWEREPSGD